MYQRLPAAACLLHTYALPIYLYLLQAIGSTVKYYYYELRALSFVVAIHTDTTLLPSMVGKIAIEGFFSSKTCLLDSSSSCNGSSKLDWLDL